MISSMKSSRFFCKYATIAVFAVSAIMFFPNIVFAKGAVIGYASGDGID
jgi:hypothetical protein